MKRIFKFLLLFVIAIPIQVFGQQEELFKKGYYITLQGDTVSGYIEQVRHHALSRKILFKPTYESKAHQVIKPSEIKEFFLSDDKILFRPVEYSYNKDTMKIIEIRNAKVILTSFVSLYKLELPEEEQNIVFEKDNTYVYMVSKAGKFYSLDQKERLIDNRYHSLDRRYRGTLNYLFSDCPSMKTKIENLEFNDKAMSKIVKEYNSCNDSTVDTKEFEVIYKPIVKKLIQVSTATMLDKDVISSRAISGGFLIDILYPHLNETVSILIGINFISLDYRTKEKIYRLNSSIPLFYRTKEKNYTLNYFRIPILGQYNFSQKKISPFLNLGITPAISTAGRANAFVSVGGGINVYKFRISSIYEVQPDLKHFKLLNFQLGYKF